MATGRGRMAALAFAGALSCGACAGGAPKIRRPPVHAAPIVEEPLRFDCMGEAYALKAGDQFSIGLTPRSGYKVTVDELGRDSLKAGVTVPVTETDGSSAITFGIRFDDVKLGRDRLIRFISEQCAILERIEEGERPRPMTASLRGPAMAATPPMRQPAPPAGTPKGSFDFGEMIRALLDKGAFNIALGGIARIQEGETPEGAGPLPFSLVSAEGRGFLLEIYGSRFAGLSFVLDREVDLGVDFFEHPPAYASIPLRIESLSSSEGRYRILIGLDCGRDVDIYFSDSAYKGPNPGCP